MNAKQMLGMIVVGAMCVVMSAPVGFADVTNVALNKPVTLNGAFFTDGWGFGLVVDADAVVDGSFFPRGHEWDQGPVWWDSSGDNTGQSIVIDLKGVYVIESFVVQADDNDAYTLYYRDIASSDWVVAWNIPDADFTTLPDGTVINNIGMQTRPNPDDDAERYLLPQSITTTALKLEADTNYTDYFLSVSEIQAYGVPEPATFALLGTGILWLKRLRTL